MGMFGAMGQCKDCKRVPVALRDGRCEQCNNFKYRIDVGVKTIDKHPDLVALDEELERWYA